MNLLLKHIALAFLFLILQVFLGNNITLFNIATPHFFLGFLLMLPMSTKYPVLILVAFFSGLTLDLLSDGLIKGLHAFSGVFIMSIRDYWVWTISNRSNYRGSEDTMLQVQTYAWYFQYLIPMILIHQAVYYFLEAFTLENFPITLLKVGTSTLYTLIAVFSTSILLYKESKR